MLPQQSLHDSLALVVSNKNSQLRGVFPLLHFSKRRGAVSILWWVRCCQKRAQNRKTTGSKIEQLNHPLFLKVIEPIRFDTHSLTLTLMSLAGKKHPPYIKLIVPPQNMLQPPFNLCFFAWIVACHRHDHVDSWLQWIQHTREQLQLCYMALILYSHHSSDVP